MHADAHPSTRSSEANVYWSNAEYVRFTLKNSKLACASSDFTESMVYVVDVLMIRFITESLRDAKLSINPCAVSTSISGNAAVSVRTATSESEADA